MLNYLDILNKEKGRLFKEAPSMVGKLFKEAEGEELELDEGGAVGEGGAGEAWDLLRGEAGQAGNEGGLCGI